MRRKLYWSRAYPYYIVSHLTLLIFLSTHCRFQRLGVDLTKAAESLRAWGVGEGDDLAVSGAFVWAYHVVQLLF